ncbi:Protein of unknown function DUF3661, vaculolar transmembrane [Plasmopara halstedii]|uniref:Transmembrane protein n=1 Tax=Plasmopara halstedii TaxID=4781 RepID=A0A0P1AI00_PLAHL|nr:Protein of unknown function DUF3661, vaculolar transmembrane [Plasmopara halstedii]CEG40374.1 Protein of unknown function DUF3661, vaculolar transmembrane [Plasmopara halstedii]|eukprot:XP_024576743.1 Protein of unknown function DUF3661, vaculolar transmembrane [Plasmopara halstedii]
MSSRCTLLADRTDDAVQMLLGFIALSSLYAKWHFEQPRRPVKVWFMDAMKQGTSAAMIHFINIFFAIGLVNFSDEPNDQDQCAFYFMNVVIDTTLGVYIAYLLLQLFTIIAMRQQWTNVRCHGYYGSPPSWRIWWIQLLQWCFILTIMKVIVGLVLFIFSTPLGWMGYLLFYPVHHHPKIELLIVMIGCPLFMNMVQFWIQDSFLKNDKIQCDEEIPLLNQMGDAFAVQKSRGLSNVANAADMRTHPGDVFVRLD